MERSIVVIGLLLTVSSLFAAEDAENREQSRDDLGAHRITKVLPAEYAAFEKALVGDNGVGDAKAATRLISQAKKLRANISPSLETLRRDHDRMPLCEAQVARQRLWDTTEAYRVSWLLCLQIFKISNDAEAKQLILNEWNKSLEEEAEYLPSQLLGLVAAWDRGLLTNELWGLLEHSEKNKTVSAICCIISEKGNQADLDRLKKMK